MYDQGIDLALSSHIEADWVVVNHALATAGLFRKLKDLLGVKSRGCRPDRAGQTILASPGVRAMRIDLDLV